jgi:hypothetical protein
MLALLFPARRRRGDFRAARRRTTRTVAGLESLEPRLALAVTLVIDPSSLNLPETTTSAWVAGYANATSTTTAKPFTWLTSTSSGGNTAHFVSPATNLPAGTPLPMVQIFGGTVQGSTTITFDTTFELAGGILQIFVSPNLTQPTAPTLSTDTAALESVGVTQISTPPYLTQPAGMVPFDLVEFAYEPGKNSTFDLTAVNGFNIPMTLTTTDSQAGPPLGSTSIGTQQTGVSRADIGTAFTKFMGTAQSKGNDPQGGSFTQLLYDAASGPFAAPPATPANQFFAIASPWYWITNQNNQSGATPTSLLQYWDSAIHKFFENGNRLSIALNADGSGPYYTGVSDGSGYTFKDQSGNFVLNSNTNQKLVFPKPSAGYESAQFMFGNSLANVDGFPKGKFPAGDAGLIIDNIMEAFSRGVALDGVLKTAAKPVDVVASPNGASSSITRGVVFTINTTTKHGLKKGDLVTISGVSPTIKNTSFPNGYNGAFPVVSTPSDNSFTYFIAPIGTPVALAPGGGGTVTHEGQSTIAWNTVANWYQPNHISTAYPDFVQPYNTYSKFLHYSTIDGTDSRRGGSPIFINNQAYGFSLDETPNGPYTGNEVPSKFDSTIQDGSQVTLSLNPWIPTSPSAPAVISLDTNPPQVGSAPTPATNGQVTWTVAFNERVSGVAKSNFSLVQTTLPGSSILSVTPSQTGGLSRTWTVTANTGAGSGTLGLNLANNVGSIKDASGHALATGKTGQVYAVSEAPPVGPTASIAIPANAQNPTSAATVTFDVTFTEPVTGLSAANFALVASPGLAGFGNIQVTPASSSKTATWTVTANTGTGSGTLALQLLAPGAGIAPTPTGLPVTSKAYTIRQTPVAPALQSISRNLPNPTDQPQVSWTVSFSEPVAGVRLDNFSLVPNGLSGARITNVVQAPGTGTGWTVTALTGSGTGTLRLDMVNANGITDAEGLAPTGIPLRGQSYDVVRGEVPGVRVPIAFWAEPGRRANLVWPRGLAPFTGPANRELTVTLAATGGDGIFAARRGIRGVTVAGTGTGPEISLTGTARNLNAYFRTAGRIGYTPSGESLLPRVLAVSATTTTDTLAGFDTAAILVRARGPVGVPAINRSAALGSTPAGTPLVITYAQFVAATGATAANSRSVEFLLGGVSSGRLELWDGAKWIRVPAVLPKFKEPILAPGGQIRWTPPARVTGQRPAFRAIAWDGWKMSAIQSQVTVDVT